MYSLPVARILTRLQGEGDGLMLGALLQAGKEYFKPNSIYEVIYCPLSGELKIKYRGSSVIAGTGQKYTDSPIKATWCTGVEDVLLHGQQIFLTTDELTVVMAERETYWNQQND